MQMWNWKQFLVQVCSCAVIKFAELQLQVSIFLSNYAKYCMIRQTLSLTDVM